MADSISMTRWQKLRTHGPWRLISNRCRWYMNRFQRDNWLIGTLVGLSGNVVRIDGLRFHIDTPLIGTREKSTLYFGLYEQEEIAFVGELLPTDQPVVELGGSIGVVSCVTNRLLERPEDHVVVEANPLLIPTLERNRDENGCRFSIVHAALAYGADEVSFGLSDCWITGSLRGGGQQVTVPALSVRQLAESRGFDRLNLIADIEGAEIELVSQEADFLASRVNWLIMETHPKFVGAEMVDRMLEHLRQLGFVTERFARNVYAMRNASLR